jgi:thymidylate synthase
MEIANNVWARLLQRILQGGDNSFPRGFKCIEVLQHTVIVNMVHPVITNQERKLNYRFMAAEAHWILTGDDRVETITPYNSKMKDFSDDGVKFFGAYGPKVMGQLDYVISKLVADPWSRQAGINIWRENPPETKDVPCTVSVFFSIRSGRVNCHVFMRSSDAWLGFPYDVFNFSMLSYLVCARLNHLPRLQVDNLEPGNLYLTMANSHLYQHNQVGAQDCIAWHNATIGQQSHPSPEILWTSEHHLLKALREIKDGANKNRWWEGRTLELDP